MGPGMGMGQGMGMGRGMGMGMGMGMGVMMAPHAQWGTVHLELRELEAAMVRVQSQEIEQSNDLLLDLTGLGVDLLLQRCTGAHPRAL